MTKVFPNGKRFAFTIFDDTDVATLGSIQPIYELLHELNIRTTKTVWPLDYKGDSPFAGSSSLEDREYCSYMQLLHARGFEIAFHGARMETSARDETARALRVFREAFGVGPTSYAAHALNRDNIYWGEDRFRYRIWRAAYRLLSKREEPVYEGHVPGSDFYWLDLAPEIRYVRNLTFDGINLSSVAPVFPYRTAGTPGVRAWFPSCDADNVEEFVYLLRQESQEELEESGGICILSTHFGKGFVRNGRVRDDARAVMEALSRRDGWFVPVTCLLDHLAETRGVQLLKGKQLFGLEAKWFLRAYRRMQQRRAYEASEAGYLEAALASRRDGGGD